MKEIQKILKREEINKQDLFIVPILIIFSFIVTFIPGIDQYDFIPLIVLIAYCSYRLHQVEAIVYKKEKK